MAAFFLTAFPRLLLHPHYLQTVGRRNLAERQLRYVGICVFFKQLERTDLASLTLVKQDMPTSQTSKTGRQSKRVASSCTRGAGSFSRSKSQAGARIQFAGWGLASLFVRARLFYQKHAAQSGH